MQEVRLTIKEMTYHRILEAIRRGDLSPGTQLTERKIAEQMGFSRTPVREAMGRIANEGIIENHAKWGYFIKEFDVTDLGMIFDVREGMEVVASRLGAANITEPDVYNLRKACAAFQQLTSWIDLTFTDCDQALHVSIAAISGNKYLENTIERYHLLSEIAVSAALFNRGNFRGQQIELEKRRIQSAQEHEAVAEAIIQQDQAGAERLMSEHIMNAKTTYVNFLRRLQS
jgi:DNA-binding GntR family transcriptional regulator